MNFLRTVWVLFATHLSLTLFSKRALLSALLVLLPVGASILVVLIARRVEGPAPVLEIGWVLQVQIVAPLVALILGSGVIAEEVDNRTISYLFTRPIRRPAILLGRWLACVLVLSMLLGISALAVRFFLGMAAQNEGAAEIATPEITVRLLRTILMAGVVYSALFAAAGAILKRSIIAGLAYTFVFEVFLANLPGSNQKISIQYYLKSYLVAEDAAILDRWDDSLARFELVPAGDATQTLLTVTVGALLLGSLVIARKQYHISA